MASPDAPPPVRFDIRLPSFREFLRVRYGDIAAPCRQGLPGGVAPLSPEQFTHLYMHAPDSDLQARGALAFVRYTRDKWAAAWAVFVAESGI